MEKSAKLIKLQREDKVVIVPRPATFAELTALFREKFRASDLHSHSLVFSDGDDDISIESDADLRHAYEFVESPKIRLLSGGEGKGGQGEQKIGVAHLSMYSAFLESALPRLAGEVGEFVERDEMPCKECFFDKQNDDSSFDLDEEYNCAACNDKGSVAMSKSWKLILLLIDFKMRQYLLQPLRNFQGTEEPERAKSNKSSGHSRQLVRKTTNLGSHADSRTSETCQSFVSRTNCKVTPLFRTHVS